MTHDIIYRQAKPTDHAAITRFQIAMAFETEGLNLDPKTCAQGVRAVFDDPRKGQYFVAEQADLVIGSLLLIDEWSDWRNGKVWWIHSVYVEPVHRGSGVFRGLYGKVQELARSDESIRGLRLYVDKRNTA